MFTEEDIQKEIDFVLKVITHPSGYDLDLFGSMGVRPTDQGVWCVNWEQRNKPTIEELESDDDQYFSVVQSHYSDKTIYKIEKSFLTAEKAAEFFVRKRYQEKIGLDFETAYYEKV